MRCQIPVLNKCCFCIPLQPGLLTYGYFKMIIVTSLLIIHSIPKLREYGLFIWLPVFISITQAIIFIIDFVSAIVFVIICHTKNMQYLNWYYSASIYILAAKTFIPVIRRFFVYPAVIIPYIVLILFDIYQLLLLRSKIIHDKDDTEQNKLADSENPVAVDDDVLERREIAVNNENDTERRPQPNVFV